MSQIPSEPDYELLVRSFCEIHGFEWTDRKRTWKTFETQSMPRYSFFKVDSAVQYYEAHTFQELYEKLLTYAPAK